MWQRFLETGVLVVLGLGAAGFLGWLLWDVPVGANDQDQTSLGDVVGGVVKKIRTG